MPGALYASTSAKRVKRKAPAEPATKSKAQAQPLAQKKAAHIEDEPEEDHEDSDDPDGEAEESEEGSDDDEVQWGAGSEESEEEDGSDDENPQMYEAPSEKASRLYRGNLKCQLCPDKIIMNEVIMEQHLESASHKRNLRHFERAKEIGVEAYEAECKARAVVREVAKNGASKRSQKKQEFWAKKRKKAKTNKDVAEKETSGAVKKVKKDKTKPTADTAVVAKQEKRKQEKDKPGKAKAGKEIEKSKQVPKLKELSQKDIDDKKRRFQEKKARRLARKATAAGPGADDKVKRKTAAAATSEARRGESASDKKLARKSKALRGDESTQTGELHKKARRKREDVAAR